MQTLYNNPDWTFIVNFFSIFLAVFSLLATVKFSFEKELDLITWDTSTIYENNSTERTSRKQLHKLSIAFQNHGKTTIYKGDILNSISIELKNMIAIKVINFESNCKFNTINHEIKNETVLFSFDFLEGRKYLKINIEYYSEENIVVNIKGKIIGGNEISTVINSSSTWENSYRIGNKDARAKIFVFPFLSLVLTSLSFQVFFKMFNLNYDDVLKMLVKFNRDSFATILIGLLIIITCILISYSIAKLFIPFASFMKKEKNWYPK